MAEAVPTTANETLTEKIPTTPTTIDVQMTDNNYNNNNNSNGIEQNTGLHEVKIDSVKKESTTIDMNTNGKEKNGHHTNDEYSDEEEEEDDDTCTLPFWVVPVIGNIIIISLTVYIWMNYGWALGMTTFEVGSVILLLIQPGWRWFYIALLTAYRDLTALMAYRKLLSQMKKFEKKNYTIGDVFEMNVAQYPEKMAIISDTQKWTFKELSDFSNKVANVFYDHGYKKGDVIGLMLENRAEYVGIWMGLSKLGCVTALINTNLRSTSLIHSITVAKCTAIIYGEDYKSAIGDITNEIPSNVALYQYNNEINQTVSSTSKDLTTLVANGSKDPISSPLYHAKHHDRLVYIYTSGTTGLPKAAVISHSRYMFIASAIHFTLGFRTKDIFYTPLPLYHTAGGMMSIGQALVFGSTIAIRKKFSASGYFSDCAKFNATISQYIGEMARYILATPPSECDKKHNIRMIYGNGLRPQIWPQFVERFNIPKVGEFYGATEGNANIMNNDNTVGAIGFISRILPQIYPISIIRVNPITSKPIRKKGLCQVCKPGEPGIFIGKIVKGNPAREFLGYVDEKASQKKVIHNVFKKGDMAFHSGDILVADERGYLYFKDRTGDTFRWKGENVSTSEVEAHVSNVAGYRDTVVYGVVIPNTDGRAGMAAILDPDRKVDLDDFAVNISKVLPPYAKPIFLRILTQVDLTGTFKLRKVDLQKEEFNPNIIQDALYYLTSTGKYEVLTPEIHKQICNNQIRF